MPEPQNSAIDAILQDRFPLKHLVGLRYAIAGKAAGETLIPDLDRQRDEIEAARLQLAALPPAQLKALHEAAIARTKARVDAAAAKKQADHLAKVAAKEAARFCNQAGADADFAHWCKADYWTLDEAVALLLGKEPGVVNPEAFKREAAADFGLFFVKADKAAEPTGLARTYQRLRTLMDRSDALAGPRLKPLAVIEWARRTDAVSNLPVPLARMAPPAVPPPATALAPTATATMSPPDESAAVPTALQNGAVPMKWTDELKSELAAYREEHGPRAAAAHYGISQARLRELLPKRKRASAGHKAFAHLMK